MFEIHAQGRSLKLIRDAEIEGLMRDYARPILKAAGLSRSNIEIVLVNDKSFNAFVADGRRIFINVGTIMQSKTPLELIGVIAHETGHLAGNHLIRLRQELANAQILSAASMLVGIAAAAAGAAAGSPDAAKAGVSVVAGGGGFARQSLLAYQRSEELTADRAALSYLERTGQSAKGMVSVFERFADQTIFSGRYIDPYARSHPMPRERLRHVQERAQRSRYYSKNAPQKLQERHKIIRAKLYGYLNNAGALARRYPSSDTSMEARYARAISLSRFGSLRKASKAFQALIRLQPQNGYFYEAQGQMYFEAGHIKKAVGAYQKAVALLPHEPLIRIAYGAALVELQDDRQLAQAISMLERGLGYEDSLASGYRFLGQAYARQGKQAMAQLAAAYEKLVRGDLKGAQSFAKRAQSKFKRGSPPWLRADDILSYKK